MPTRVEVLTALLGALKLARFDPNGTALFGHTARAAWQSFFAALLAAPFFLFLVIFNFYQEPDAGPALIFALISYAGGWLVFPVVVWYAVRAMDREDRFAHFLAAYNWSAVIYNTLFFLLAFIDAVTGTSTGARAFFALLIFAYVAVFIWFIARTTLDINRGQAALIVGLDVLSAIVWSGFTETLASGN
tara:strand:- start:27572 stop:28138 length:567 start_codon:yes stop_codon:yes gene_type:complete